MLELPDKNFKASVIKILQWAITNTPETNEKTESQQRNKRYKEQRSGNFRTEKIQQPKLTSLDGLNSKMSITEESVNLKRYQQKLSNLNNEKIIEWKRVYGTSGTCRTITKISHSCHPSLREEKEWAEKLFE